MGWESGPYCIRIIFVILLSMGLAACNADSAKPDAVTTESLFWEMVDLESLTRFPDPAYRTIQYSSYDRRSQVPGGPDWFANSDGFGGEPIPNFEKVIKPPNNDGIGEYIIADVSGPGAIVRLWSAAISGTIKLYLDQQPTPLYDGPAIDFFHRTLDGFPDLKSLDQERLEKTIYQRDASYSPIPFAKHLKIIWIGDLETIHFYQVQVRLYEPGTDVITFSPSDLTNNQQSIDEVTAILHDPDKHFDKQADTELIAIEASLKSEEEKELLRLDGPQALERIDLKLHAKDMELALRQTVLHIICDDHPWGQVQSPLGDFFGAAPGINPYVSLPFSVHPDGTMTCRFVMPFAENMTLKIQNLGDHEISIQGQVQAIDYSWDKERSMHFRARWRVDHELIASNQAVQDLPFLIAHGQGVYVGSTSYILNPNQVPTPYGNWWGEGDEKILVDDDKVPSIFGTGSEDYYNYSWSSPDIFYFPFCGQPRNDGPGNRGFVTNFRWHVLDPIPFCEHIRFFMELFSHEHTPGLSYARIGYHYARPGATDDHTAIMPEDVRRLELLKDWQPAARMGARNSVFFAAEDIVLDRRQIQLRKGNLWAEGNLLAWYPKQSGDSKTFRFEIPEAGNYRIYITAALTPRSGMVSIQLNGKSILLRDKNEQIDLYRPYRTLLRNFALQDQNLQSGDHFLALIYAGSNEKVKQPEVGIDFIWIQKIED